MAEQPSTFEDTQARVSALLKQCSDCGKKANPLIASVNQALKVNKLPATLIGRMLVISYEQTAILHEVSLHSLCYNMASFSKNEAVFIKTEPLLTELYERYIQCIQRLEAVVGQIPK
jgi:hypothetical protein